MTVSLQELGDTSVSKRQLLFWVLLLAMYNLVHGQLGVMVGIISFDKVEELIIFVK